MGKLTWLLYLLLMNTISFVSLPLAIANASSSTSLSVGGDIKTDQASTIIAISYQQKENKSLWGRLQDIFRDKGRDTNDRGDDFCLISPNTASNKTWSNRPLFVWQGTIKEIMVTPPGGPNRDSALWIHQVQPREQSIVYSGQELQRGQRYFFWYKTADEQRRPVSVSFEVMGNVEYEQHAAQLSALASPSNTVTTEELEKLAEKRAHYFGQKNLFLDVVRELFSLPSWDEKTQELGTAFCEAHATSNLLTAPTYSYQGLPTTVKPDQ